jgi:hypothetical protein
MEEAYMNSKYIDGAIWKLTQDQFESYRDKYIVQGEQPNNKAVYNVFVALTKVTDIAKKIRERYSATMKNEWNYDDELDFVFTIRDGNYVMQDYNHTWDIKQSLKDVILHKISDQNHKDVAEGIIVEVCG